MANDLRRHGLAVDGGRTRGGEETRLLTKDGLAAAAIDLDREPEEMGGMPKSAGRSGASQPMTVNETVIALIRPKPDLDLVAGEPAEAVAAAQTAFDAPDGIGTCGHKVTDDRWEAIGYTWDWSKRQSHPPCAGTASTALSQPRRRPKPTSVSARSRKPRKPRRRTAAGSPASAPDPAKPRRPTTRASPRRPLASLRSRWRLQR